jgi:hypothetical protein
VLLWLRFLRGTEEGKDKGNSMAFCGWGGLVEKETRRGGVWLDVDARGVGPGAGTTRARRRRAAVDVVLPLDLETGEGVGRWRVGPRHSNGRWWFVLIQI